MKRPLTVLGGFACLGLAISSSYFAAVPGGSAVPSPPERGVVIENGLRDFGAVAQMETLTGEFRLTNDSRDTVELVEFLKTCSCADAVLVPARLAPGESGVLTVTWRTGTRRGKVTDELRVLMRSTDQRAVRVLRIVCRADVRPETVCEPEEVRFDVGKRAEITLRFRPGACPDTRLVSAYPSVPSLAVIIDPADGRVVVSYDGSVNDDGSDVRATVMVQTTSVKEPWVSVPVYFTR